MHPESVSVLTVYARTGSLSFQYLLGCGETAVSICMCVYVPGTGRVTV